MQGEGEAAQLTIVEGKRRLALKATGDQDLDEWREEIEQVIEPLRQMAVAAEADSPRPGKLVSGAL